MDSDVEQMAHTCNECSSNQKSPAKSPLHPWEWPSQPWFRVHLDYAGPFMGKMFLIIVDAHSKWIDVHPTSSSTSEITIEKLRITFANLGLPHQIVTDNGSCFTSTEFKNFTTANGIKHIFTAPYHASSNGLAERAVQSLKQSMRNQTGGTVQMKVSRFLFQYRTTPHSTTGVSPAELLLTRKLRNHLDLLRPDLATKVLQKQSCQKDAYDRHAKYCEIHENDKVLVKDFTSKKPVWLPGVLTKETGPVSAEVQLQDGQGYVSRHQDHIHRRHEKSPNTPELEKGDSPVSPTNGKGDMTTKDKDDITTELAKTHTRPRRDRKRPAYLKDYMLS